MSKEYWKKRVSKLDGRAVGSGNALYSRNTIDAGARATKPRNAKVPAEMIDAVSAETKDTS